MTPNIPPSFRNLLKFNFKDISNKQVQALHLFKLHNISFDKDVFKSTDPRTLIRYAEKLVAEFNKTQPPGTHPILLLNGTPPRGEQDATTGTPRLRAKPSTPSGKGPLAKLNKTIPPTTKTSTSTKWELPHPSPPPHTLRTPHGISAFHTTSLDSATGLTSVKQILNKEDIHPGGESGYFITSEKQLASYITDTYTSRAPPWKNSIAILTPVNERAKQDFNARLAKAPRMQERYQPTIIDCTLTTTKDNQQTPRQYQMLMVQLGQKPLVYQTNTDTVYHIATTRPTTRYQVYIPQNEVTDTQFKALKGNHKAVAAYVREAIGASILGEVKVGAPSTCTDHYIINGVSTPTACITTILDIPNHCLEDFKKRAGTGGVFMRPTQGKCPLKCHATPRKFTRDQALEHGRRATNHYRGLTKTTTGYGILHEDSEEARQAVIQAVRPETVRMYGTLAYKTTNTPGVHRYAITNIPSNLPPNELHTHFLNSIRWTTMPIGKAVADRRPGHRGTYGQYVLAERPPTQEYVRFFVDHVAATIRIERADTTNRGEHFSTLTDIEDGNFFDPAAVDGPELFNLLGNDLLGYDSGDELEHEEALTNGFYHEAPPPTLTSPDATMTHTLQPTMETDATSKDEGDGCSEYPAEWADSGDAAAVNLTSDRAVMALSTPQAPQVHLEHLTQTTLPPLPTTRRPQQIVDAPTHVDHPQQPDQPDAFANALAKLQAAEQLHQAAHARITKTDADLRRDMAQLSAAMVTQAQRITTLTSTMEAMQTSMQELKTTMLAFMTQQQSQHSEQQQAKPEAVPGMDESDGVRAYADKRTLASRPSAEQEPEPTKKTRSDEAADSNNGNAAPTGVQAALH